MSLDQRQRIFEIVAGGVLVLVFGIGSWLCTVVIDLKAQVQVLTQQQSNIIPPIVEQSFAEVRHRMNSEQAEKGRQLTELTGTAIGNAKDIGYLKERVSGLEASIGKQR